MGAQTSDVRTPHQTLMARYRITPDMMPTLRMSADAPGRSLVENARLFALFAMAGDDTNVALGDAKLHYNFWRPIVAIRNAADDGNEGTQSDPKPAIGVRVSSRSIPTAAVQVLPTWDEWVRQVSASRIYGGVHYRFSNEAGEEIGRNVGRLTVAKLMRPLPPAQQRPAR